ncbi:MAG: hypothetical protein K8R21_03105 [Leptospira sp.]|nr:hypothetical protein [Leptospira sp.]
MGKNGIKKQAPGSKATDDTDSVDEAELERLKEDESISVVKVKGNEKYLKWVKESHKKAGLEVDLSDQEILNEVESFFVPSFTDKENVKEFFAEYGEDIFYFMFAIYFRDKALFPKYKGIETLNEWFEIDIDEYIKSFEEVLDFVEGIDTK